MRRNSQRLAGARKGLAGIGTGSLAPPPPHVPDSRLDDTSDILWYMVYIHTYLGTGSQSLDTIRYGCIGQTPVQPLTHHHTPIGSICTVHLYLTPRYSLATVQSRHTVGSITNASGNLCRAILSTVSKSSSEVLLSRTPYPAYLPVLSSLCPSCRTVVCESACGAKRRSLTLAAMNLRSASLLVSRIRVLIFPPPLIVWGMGHASGRRKAEDPPLPPNLCNSMTDIQEGVAVNSNQVFPISLYSFPHYYSILILGNKKPRSFSLPVQPHSFDPFR